ncbi:MAG: hypothetical protein ACRD1L_12920 [Terriglobales bacterium]
MPPATAQAAIVLGFLCGIWMLVDGANQLITGDYIRLHGQLGPWARFVAAAGLDPMRLGWVIVLFGALWMVVPNLYLFQNVSANWRAMVILIVLSSWYLGWGTALLLPALILLLLPATRKALR